MSLYRTATELQYPQKARIHLTLPRLFFNHNTESTPMSHIAILTPDHVDPQTESAWQQRFEMLQNALQAQDLRVDAVPWTTPLALTDYALVLPLLAWGYHRDPALWRAQLARWQAGGVRLQNSALVLAQNFDKRYLATLAGRGVTIVPTRFSEQLSTQDLDAAAQEFGATALVIKPTISAGAFQTLRWYPAQQDSASVLRTALAPSGPCLLQPYLQSVADFGEVSLIYFSGQFSHAVIKRPQSGDFRVQTGFGGQTTAYAAAPEFLSAGAKVLQAMQTDLLYARVDLLALADGQIALMELEATEPDLFLDYDAAAGARFAAAVRGVI
jgi:glutathione synthase/RimK-type ligase-like ATP-grasp enzyme